MKEASENAHGADLVSKLQRLSRRKSNRPIKAKVNEHWTMQQKMKLYDSIDFENLTGKVD